MSFSSFCFLEYLAKTYIQYKKEAVTLGAASFILSQKIIVPAALRRRYLLFWSG